jgi:hypothetical protein
MASAMRKARFNLAASAAVYLADPWRRYVLALNAMTSFTVPASVIY